MTEPEFLLPSQTKAPSKASSKATPSDPGYVPGVGYDQHGRYLLPTPGEDPGCLSPWTRVTTLAGVVTSQEGLRVYTERKIARGFGLRADVRALVSSDPDSTKVQDEALAVAKEAAGVGAEARGGTARHSLLEHWARMGELRVGIDEPAGRDLLAAVTKLTTEGMKPYLLEQLVVHEHLNYAGRLDQLVRVTLPDGRTVLRILDAKFGEQVTKPRSRHQIGVQLALYANATHSYDDPTTRTFTPMPAELDRSTGYVLHVHDGVAELHEVDLVVGWQCAKTAVLLHQQRKASVTFLPVGQPVTVAEPASAATPEEGEPPAGATPNTTASQAWQAVVARFEAIASDREVKSFSLPDIPDPTPAERTLNTPLALSPQPGHPDVQEDPRLIEGDALLPVGANWSPGEHEGGPGLEVPRAAAATLAGVLSPTGRKRRACSKCRIPGHTAKNCPGVGGDGTGVEDGPQSSAQPVDDPAKVKDLGNGIMLCRHLSGWAARPSDGVYVCADCGRPSEATAARIRGTADEALAAVLGPVTQQDPRFGPVLQQPPPVAPTLLERIATVESLEELGQLWEECKQEWTEEHTAAARARQAQGLPSLAAGESMTGQ